MSPLPALSSLLLVAAVPAGTVLLHRLLLPGLPLWPFPPAGESGTRVTWRYDRFGQPQPVEEPAERFPWLDLLLAPACCVACGLATTAWVALLDGLSVATWGGPPEPAGAGGFAPAWAPWVGPGAVLGLITSLLPLGFLARLLLGGRFRAYTDQPHVRAARDAESTPAARFASLLALGMLLATVALPLVCHR